MMLLQPEKSQTFTPVDFWDQQKYTAKVYESFKFMKGVFKARKMSEKCGYGFCFTIVQRNMTFRQF